MRRNAGWAALALFPAVAALVGLAGGPAVLAQPRASGTGDPTAQTPTNRPAAQPDERLQQRDRLARAAQKLRAEGKLKEAAAAGEQTVAVERELHGNTHQVAESLGWLAGVYEELEDFAAARKSRQERLDVVSQLYGKENWRTTDARLDLADVERLAALEPAQRRQLAQANRSNSEAVALYRSGKYKRAVELGQQVADLHRQILGEDHVDFANCLVNLGAYYRAMGDVARAEQIQLQVLAIRKKLLGELHPDYAASLSYLGALYAATYDWARAESYYRRALEIRRKVLGEEHFRYAISLSRLGALYKSMGDYARAEPLYLQALAIRKKVLGEEHPDYAASLSDLAGLYESMSDYRRAEPLYRQALAITKKARGTQHPAYLSNLSSLGNLYRMMGDYARAEEMLLGVLESNKTRLGAEHPTYAKNLSDLGTTYLYMGDYQRAEPLYQEALRIRKKSLGEEHADYATSLNNLGSLRLFMGDNERAETLLRQALAIRKRVLGAEHPNYSVTLNNLGRLYETIGDYARAEPLYQEALEIRKKTLGEEHPRYATSLNNLALLYRAMGDYERAEPLHRRALAIRKKVLGEEHPDYATSLNNLALLYRSMGEAARAEPLCRQALFIDRKLLGEHHPNCAIDLNNLAAIYESMNDFERAESHLGEALEITRRNMNLTAEVQSERQQLAMTEAMQYQLHNYVSLAVRTGRFSDPAYRRTLEWKGAVLSRQRQLRALADEPELEPLWNALQTSAAQLARLALAEPEATASDADARRRRIADLSAEKERLEAQLAQKSAAFRDARRQVTLEDVQAALPADSVLVDFLEHAYQKAPEEGKKEPGKWERRFAAFVVSPSGPVQLIGLGPVAPIAEAIDTWRSTFGVSAESASAGRLLRQKIWEPLEEHIAGAKIVLVAPDGVLGRLPLAALPGKEPSTFLLEERTLAVLPVPQLLPALTAGEGGKQPAANVLLLGAVDYGAEAAEAAERKPFKTFPGSKSRSIEQSWRGEFKSLDATAGEIATVERRYRDLFGDEGITVLKGAAASETALRTEAPRHLFLHLATHGFFAPPSLKSALSPDPDRETDQGRMIGRSDEQMDVAGVHPGLLSGVVLAGANRKPRADGDDGILTAEEVALLNLSGCRMCVLSACETGLGEVAGGEGLLGLQRAFQVAGARSTVSSLWKVDDTATRSLMERFYKNLWERELPAVEALREAQIWMLRDSSNRGLAIADQPATDHLPPYYWAAFVLSGDWR